MAFRFDLPIGRKKVNFADVIASAGRDPFALSAPATPAPDPWASFPLPTEPRETELPADLEPVEPTPLAETPRALRAPTRLESMEGQLDQPESWKRRLLKAAIPAAGIALGGIFGGEAGASGAAQGVQSTLANQQAIAERRRGQLLEQIEAERNRQERMEERGMTLAQQIAAMRQTAAEAEKNRQSRERIAGTFTLGEGQQRIGPTGNVIATGPEKPPVLHSVAPGGTLVDPTGKVVATGGPKPISYQSVDLDVGGKPVKALFNPENGQYIDPTTRQPIQNPKAFRQPSVSLMNRDEMMPVIDRVARGLAGVDAKGNPIPPDLTSLRQISSLRGDQRLLLYDKVKQYNPKFNTSEIDRKIKMMDWAENGKGADQLQSYGTFLEHAGALADVVKFAGPSSPYLNRPINWIRANFQGDPNLTRLWTALEPVKKEYESFLLNNRALYSEDRESADKIVNDNSTLNMLLAATKQMGHTVEARANEINHRYKKVIGTDLQDVYSPDAQEGARKLGLKMGGAAGTSESEAVPAVKVQRNQATGQYRYSTDGGKTWQAGKPPNQ